MTSTEKMKEDKSKALKSNENMSPHILKLKTDHQNAKNTKFVDKEMGSLRSNYNIVKNFFRNIFSYVGSFFTKKKVEEIKTVFMFKKPKNRTLRSSIGIKENLHPLKH